MLAFKYNGSWHIYASTLWCASNMHNGLVFQQLVIATADHCYAPRSDILPGCIEVEHDSVNYVQ